MQTIDAEYAFSHISRQILDASTEPQSAPFGYGPFPRSSKARFILPAVPHPPFSELADVYDELMADVDYEAWVDFILEQSRLRGYRGGTVLELGCGTGNLVLPFVERGLPIVGLDNSSRMLAVARAKAPHLDWRLGEFVSFDLQQRFELVVSVFDSLNNLVAPEDFRAAANRVRQHLRQGGLFVFDVNTSVGLGDLWEGGAVEGWAGETFFRWEHSFDPESGLARVEAFCDSGDRSFTEVHFERAYDADEVRELLTSAHFGSIETLRFPGGEPADADDPRIWVLASAV